MLDYAFCRSDDVAVKVSEMTDAEIAELLTGDFEVYDGTPRENIMERLRIEALIRELGL